MIEGYKLTDENGQTHNNTQWGPNITHEAPGQSYLCTGGWIHYYTDPYLAIFMNPIHADFVNPKLWSAKVEGNIKEETLKCGCQKLTTIRELNIHTMTIENRVKIGIRCAMLVYKEPRWVKWANKWLDGVDRSVKAAIAVMGIVNTKGSTLAEWAASDAAEAVVRAEIACWAVVNVMDCENSDNIDIVSIIKEVVEK